MDLISKFQIRSVRKSLRHTNMNNHNEKYEFSDNHIQKHNSIIGENRKTPRVKMNKYQCFSIPYTESTYLSINMLLQEYFIFSTHQN